MKKQSGPIQLTSLNLGSAIYQVEYVEKLLGPEGSRKLSGNINHEKCVMQIDPAADGQSVAETIIHEAIHFFIAHYGQSSAIIPDREEDLINTLSNGFLLLMRLNPAFVGAVQEL